MTAIITIFKSELKNNNVTVESINEFSSETKEIGDAFTISPKSGKLFELLTFLKKHHITYGTHFDTNDIE